MTVPRSCGHYTLRTDELPCPHPECYGIGDKRPFLHIVRKTGSPDAVWWSAESTPTAPESTLGITEEVWKRWEMVDFTRGLSRFWAWVRVPNPREM